MTEYNTDRAAGTVGAPQRVDHLHPVCEEWLTFLRVIASPWVILTALGAAGFRYLAVRGLVGAASKELIAVVDVVFALFVGVLGGILARRWDAISEEKLIVARGKMAIRSLLLLAKNIGSLNANVDKYLQRTDGAEDRDFAAEIGLVRVYLEEITRDCQTLGDETKNAINDWREVIPEAAVDVQVGQYHEYQLENASLVQRIADLETSLEESKLDGQKVADLRSQVDAAVLEVVRLRREQLARDPFQVGPVGSTIGTSSVEYGSGTILVQPFIKDHLRTLQERDQQLIKAFTNQLAPLPRPGEDDTEEEG